VILGIGWDADGVLGHGTSSVCGVSLAAGHERRTLLSVRDVLTPVGLGTLRRSPMEYGVAGHFSALSRWRSQEVVGRKGLLSDLLCPWLQLP